MADDGPFPWVNPWGDPMAPVSTRFSTQRDMFYAVWALKRPRSGLSIQRTLPQDDGSIVAFFSVEIPRTRKSRILVFEARANEYVLIDDFVVARRKAPGTVKKRGDKLVYPCFDNTELERPVQDGES